MKMHWCTAKLNLSGQDYTIIVFDKTDPVSWPEVQVLMALHGEENVYEVKPCADAEIINPKQEKDRLLAKYGIVTEKVFPGYSPRMETLMPGEPETIESAPAVAPVNGNGPDDEDEDDGDEGVGKEPPVGPAVFKPSRHPRPSA